MTTLSEEQVRAAAADITKKRRPLTNKQREQRQATRLRLQEIKARGESRQATIEAETGALVQRRAERQRLQSRANAPTAVARVATAPLAGESQLGGVAKAGPSWIMVGLGTFAVLIVLYLVISKPQPTGTFLSSISDWLHTMSANTPLFSNISSGG